MNQDKSAIDLMDMSVGTFKAYSLKKDDNKENTKIVGAQNNNNNNNIANVSISSLGAGILSEANLNLSNSNGMMNSFFNPNESYDCNLDAYEKSLSKLGNENKVLRKRVKNLTDLARAKQQEIFELVNRACEDRQKLEVHEKIRNKQEHESQLQSYYECFISIEKENSQLKLKIDQMRAKLIEQQDKLEEATSRAGGSTPNELKVDLKPVINEKEDECEENENLNAMSMRHINDELNNATKTAVTFIEENMVHSSPVNASNSLMINDPNIQEIADLKQKIDELILEKTTLEKKLDSIEKALQRWIFRACDDKCNLKKMEENYEKLDNEFKILNEEHEKLKHEKQAESNLLELNRIQLEDTNLILEQTKLLLDDKDIYINKLFNSNKRLETENQAIIVQLEHYVNKSFLTAETQTDSATNTNNSKTTSSCSKLNELSALNGHVAKTAAKFGTNQQQPVLNQQSSSSDLTGELKQVKLKNDNLIIEKSQLKFKNDELKFENEENKSKMEDLIRQIENFKQISSTSQTTNVPTAVKSTVTIKPLITQSVQTTRIQINNQETQTNQIIVHQNTGSDLLWKARFDSAKQELDHTKSESLAEMNKLKNSLSNQIETLQKHLNKLEHELKEEKIKITKLNELNAKTSADLELKQTECISLVDTITKINEDHLKQKKISDTIINQQKKLLNFVQNKLNPDENYNGPANHQLNTANHHLGVIKLFKRNKQNPLLANLNKPAIPYQFANNNTTSSSSSSSNNGTLSSTTSSKLDKKTVTEIEAELNSNYVAYSELARERKPPTIPIPVPKPLQQQQQLQLQQPQDNNDLNSKNNQIAIFNKLHVFITGLNTCPIYCDVCQHLIPLIAYASKCQLCSFTLHSTCSNLKKSMSNKSKAGLAVTAAAANNNSNAFDPLKYCHMNYLKISQLYTTYINKLSNSINVNYLDKSSSSLLADYLHVYMDNKWKKYWVVLRLDAQLEIYQTKTNLKPFETVNLLTERIMFETDYNIIKKLVSSSSSLLSTNSQKHQQQEDEVNLYEQVDPNHKQALIQDQLIIDFVQSSLIILVYNQRISHQIGFESFGTKSVWLDALQSAGLISHKQKSKQAQAVATTISTSSIDDFQLYILKKVLNPFLELSDTTVNSYCVINQKMIALACDDGLYINQIETESSSSNISLIKIDTIESAHKLSYQAEYGKLCLIGRRMRQFLSIDMTELLEKPLVEPASANNENYEQDEDYPKINVKIEHVQNLDRCHLFESYLGSNNFWYLAIATPETISILLFNKTTSKYTLVKTINCQSDSPCLCLKFSHFTNQLIYGCSKEFFKLDMTYLQPTPIMDSLITNNKKNNNNFDDDYSQLVKLQKQPIAISVINLSGITENTAVLLCYEEYALVLTFNKVNSNWQLQQSVQQQISNAVSSVTTLQQQVSSSKSKSSSSSSLSTNLSNHSCLKWPRGSPPLQIEFNSDNLYLFYNDSIIVYKVSFDSTDSLFIFKKSGVAFVYKPRHLSSFHLNENDSYLTISIRRPVIDTNVKSSSNENNTPYYDYEANENDYNDEDMLNEDELIKQSSTKIIGLEQEENDRICLAYFCCP